MYINNSVSEFLGGTPLPEFGQPAFRLARLIRYEASSPFRVNA